MRAIRLLSLRRLRLQPLRATIALLAVASGVSLAVAIGVVTTSISTSYEEHGRRLAGPAPLRVVGPSSRGGFDEAAISTIAATRGVESAVPMIQAVTITESADGREEATIALGVDCRVQALIGDVGCDEATLAAPGDNPIAVSAALRDQLGAGAVIRTDIGRIDLDSAFAVDQLDQLNEGRVVVFSLAGAQRLFARPDRVDVVYVTPAEGFTVGETRRELERSVGEWNRVLTADEPPPEIRVITGTFLPIFGMLGMFALGTGAVLVHNTVALSMEERRRQLAVVAALGGSRRVVGGGAVIEAATLGLLGGLVGAGAGVLVATPITASISDFTQKIAGLGLRVHVSPGTVVLGAVLGTALGAVAAAGPVRRALRMDVAAELSNRDSREEATAPRLVRRLVLSMAAATIGLVGCFLAQRNGALEMWQATIAPFAFILAALMLLIAGTSAAPLMLRALEPRSARWGGAWRLAIANLVREPKRAGVMSVAVCAAVLVAFVAGSFNRAVRNDIVDGFTRDDVNGVAVSTLEPNNTVNIDAKVSPDVVEGIRALPEVASAYRGAAVMLTDDEGKIVGVGAFENPWLDLDVIVGTKDRSRFDAGEVLIGPGLARERGLRPGDDVRLATATGFVDLPIQGVWQDGDFSGRNVALPLGLLEQLYGPQPPTNLWVVPEDGVTPEAARDAIIAAGLDPDVQAETGADLADAIASGISEMMAPFWVLQRGLLGVAFVAVFTTLLLVGVQRQREHALLGAVGMEPGSLARMVLAEAGLVAVIGVVLGAVSGLATFWALLQLAPIMVGFRNSFDPDFMTLVPYGAIALTVTLLAALWPARRAARLDVVTALQYE